MADNRITFELRGTVAFSHLYGFGHNSEGNPNEAHDVTITFPKAQSKELQKELHKLVGNKRLTPEICRLTDGDTTLNKNTGEPVAPGEFQLDVYCFKGREAKVVDQNNQPIELKGELGRGSEVVLGISARVYQGKIYYTLLKTLLLKYVDPFTADDDFTFSRFQNADGDTATAMPPQEDDDELGF